MYDSPLHDMSLVKGTRIKDWKPVCVLRCRWSSSLRVNLLPQNIQVQTNGRSPECQRRWALKC